MGELISRYKLLEEMNNKEIEMEFELPVQEILGKDVDMDDFCMLVQEFIKKYRELIVGVIRKQPTAYNVEKVVQQLEDTKCEYEQLANNPFTNMEWQEDIELLAKAEICEYALEIVRNGGKE